MKRKILTVLFMFILTSAAYSCRPGSNSLAIGLSAAEPGSAILESGLKILTFPNNSTPVITIAARLNVGAGFETDKEAGYSSLLGQLFFKSAGGSVADRFLSLGTTLNVDLKSEATYFRVTVLSEDAVDATSTLLELLTTSYEDETILHARDQLVAEFERALNLKAIVTQDSINTVLFPDSPFGVGTRKRIDALKSLKPQTFNSFLNRCLQPSGSAFSLVGDLTQEFLDEFIAAVSNWKTNVVAEASVTKEEDAKTETAEGKPFRIVGSSGDTAALFFLRPIPALQPEGYYSMRAINHILNGRSTYGRLSALRLDKKLESEISSDLELNRFVASHTIRVSIPANRAGDIFSRVLYEMQTLYNGTVMNSRLLEQEITDARNFLSGQLMRQTETNAQIARFLLWADFNGFESTDPAEHLSLIVTISKEHLLNVIESNFKPGIVALIALGPAEVLVKEFEEFGEIEVVE